MSELTHQVQEILLKILPPAYFTFS